MGRGEEAAHRAALRDAEQHGAPRADGVEHRAHVVHPLLERRQRVTGSDRPVPRLSKRISRENDASRLRNRAKDGSFQKYSRCETQPMTKTRSSGPSPHTW